LLFGKLEDQDAEYRAKKEGWPETQAKKMHWPKKRAASLTRKTRKTSCFCLQWLLRSPLLNAKPIPGSEKSPPCSPREQGGHNRQGKETCLQCQPGTGDKCCALNHCIGTSHQPEWNAELAKFRPPEGKNRKCSTCRVLEKAKTMQGDGTLDLAKEDEDKPTKKGKSGKESNKGKSAKTEEGSRAKGKQQEEEGKEKEAGGQGKGKRGKKEVLKSSGLN
jgi:hypothetical protein